MGDKVVNNDSPTPKRIAENGADIFYSGAIAHEIIEDMNSNDALLTINDLKNYQTKRSKPLWGNYRGYDIATNNPPGGGIMLIQMLNILENFDLLNLGHNSVIMFVLFVRQ